MKNLQVMFGNIRGSAIMALLILIPVLTIGSVATYKMTRQGLNVSLQASAEENAYFAAEGATERVMAEILADTPASDTLRTTIYNATEGTEPASSLGTQSSPQTYSLQQNRYSSMTARYVTTKVTPRTDAPLNTIAIQVEARLYNATPVNWDDNPVASKITYQELDGGTIKVTGCAANYDFFAGHDYNNAGLFSMMSFSTGSHYAGNEWRSCPLFSFFSFSNECVDQPSSGNGVYAKFFFIGCVNKCGSGDNNCNANAITFGDAIGTPGINSININGNVDTYQNSQEKFVMDRISNDAQSQTSHANALSAMQNDPKVKNLGSWYFRDANGNNIPDIDSPYFYHDGSSISGLPMSINMFRFKNVYLYIDGNMTSLSFMSGEGFNGSQLNIIASGDISDFSMMNMELATAGIVAITGGSYTLSDMMSMSGFSNVTLLSNNDINLVKGFDMSFGKRMHLVAANDISIIKGFSMGGTHGYGGKCGCTGTSEETTDFSVGRRFNG